MLLWTVLHPSSAPIKTGVIRQAAQTGVEDDVQNVAKRFATNLVTFNYQSADADITRLEKDTTTNFTHTNQAALPSGTVDDFKRDIVSKKSVSTGSVKGTTVTSIDKDTATVLVVVVQNHHNATTTQRTEFHVLELTLVNNGGWKVDQVGNPSTS